MERFDNEIKIHMAALSENEAFARISATAFIAGLNPTVSEMTDIKTSVSEAVTNAVIHGYENDPSGEIILILKRQEKEIHIEIKDFGRGIDDIKKAMEPLYTSKPELERSGMGFTVMETFMDEIKVESAPGMGTSVYMKKKLSDN